MKELIAVGLGGLLGSVARQSPFDFYWVEDRAFGMSPAQSVNYAMGRISYLERAGRELDRQQCLLLLNTAATDVTQSAIGLRDSTTI